MNWHEVPGWTNGGLEELYRKIVQDAPEWATIVEIGAWLGRSTALMGTLIRDTKPSLRFYTVEHGLGTPGEPLLEPFLRTERTCLGALHRNLLDCGVAGHVAILAMDSARAAWFFTDPPLCDVVIVDGNHSHEGVRSDLDDWWATLKPGGWLYGHDYDLPSVRDVVERRFAGFEVHRFGALCFGVQKPNAP